MTPETLSRVRNGSTPVQQRQSAQQEENKNGPAKDTNEAWWKNAVK
jgi:hypothetical protein